MKIFNTENINLLKKSLDVYGKQHEAIAKNIANANNPEYKRADTDFSNTLKKNIERTLKTTDPRHIAEPKTPTGKGRDSGEEEIDLSREMGELAENQIRYDFSARMLQKTYQILNLSIKGRN